MKDLPRRALTAVFFVAIMLGGILWSRVSFSILVFVINAGCLFEYLRLIRKFQSYSDTQATVAFTVTMLFGILLHAAGAWLSNDSFVFLIAVFIVPMILLLFVTEFFLNTAMKFRNALLNAGGLIYVSLFLFCFYVLTAPPFMLGAPNTLEWYPRFAVIPLGVILLIWVNDTFAYFVGSLTGNHKMFPSISPKKSWEGFFGGLIFALATAWILSGYFSTLIRVQWLMVAVLVAFFGTIGDFFESMLKRKAGIKDSGNLLPGHGGFLDRFDALLFCLPVVTVYILLVR